MPLLRVQSGKNESHIRDTSGRIVNPVIHPGRLPKDQFPTVHGLETRLMWTCPLVAFATALMGGPVALLQSAWWPSSLGTRWHRDHNPYQPGQPLLGVWMALEPISRSAGPFVVFDKSHRLRPDSELDRALADSERQYQAHYVKQESVEADAVSRTHRRLTEGLARQGSTPVVFELGIGDVVAWDAATVHGSETPAENGGTRSSLLFHFIRQ